MPRGHGCLHLCYCIGPGRREWIAKSKSVADLQQVFVGNRHFWWLKECIDPLHKKEKRFQWALGRSLGEQLDDVWLNLACKVKDLCPGEGHDFHGRMRGKTVGHLWRYLVGKASLLPRFCLDREAIGRIGALSSFRFAHQQTSGI